MSSFPLMKTATWSMSQLSALKGTYTLPIGTIPGFWLQIEPIRSLKDFAGILAVEVAG